MKDIEVNPQERIDPIEAFNQNLIEDGKSPSTVRSYIGDVKGFRQYLDMKGINTGWRISRAWVTSYRRYLVESGAKPATVNKKINSLRAYAVFLSPWGEADPGAVDPKKDRVRVAQGSEGEVEVFSDKEIEALMFLAYDSKRASQRDKTILLLLNYTGIRAGELVGIKLRDIDCIGLSLMIPWVLPFTIFRTKIITTVPLKWIGYTKIIL